jgi:hypothetical protein
LRRAIRLNCYNHALGQKRSPCGFRSTGCAIVGTTDAVRQRTTSLQAAHEIHLLAGLEHSGTTLINHVLSQHRDVMGLGEVAPFFSRHHMTQYMARWGEYADARLCSCGETWERCPFWGGLVELNGLNSNRPILEKYHRLVHYIRSHSMAEPIVVDSSKSYSFLRTILDHHGEIGLEKDDISVILSVKDVRSFATSIAKKQGATISLLSHLRTFNWWVSENKKNS